jgi:Protein of unknown function (DUF4231)
MREKGEMDERAETTRDRLEDQIGWYDKKSRSAQRWYKTLKLIQVLITALIPLASVLPVPEPRWVTAVLGLIVLVIEALQQMNQYQQNWISYRTTCESLKHEKYLFLAETGPYENANRPVAVLANRIEALISQEHAKWVSNQEQEANKKAPGAAQGSSEARG